MKTNRLSIAERFMRKLPAGMTIRRTRNKHSQELSPRKSQHIANRRIGGSRGTENYSDRKKYNNDKKPATAETRSTQSRNTLHDHQSASRVSQKHSIAPTTNKPLPKLPCDDHAQRLLPERNHSASSSISPDSYERIVALQRLQNWEWPPATNTETLSSQQDHPKDPIRPKRPILFLRDILTLPSPMQYPWHKRSPPRCPQHQQNQNYLLHLIDSTTDAFTTSASPYLSAHDLETATRLISLLNINHLTIWEYEAYLYFVSQNSTPLYRNEVLADAGFRRLKKDAANLGVQTRGLRVWEMVGLLREISRRRESVRVQRERIKRAIERDVSGRRREAGRKGRGNGCSQAYVI